MYKYKSELIEYYHRLAHGKRGQNRNIVQLMNESEHAQTVHDMEGYSVVNEDILAANINNRIEVADFFTAITPGRLERVLWTGLDRTVKLFQSFAGGYAPPLKNGGPRRPRHAGGLRWADRTTDLASNYVGMVNGKRKEYRYEGRRYQ